MIESKLKIEIVSGVAEVQLNRPQKLNALDFGTFEELATCGSRLAQDLVVRAVVLSGGGASFSVGIDRDLLSNSHQIASNLQKRAYGDCNLFQHVVMQWHRLPIPVIAAIHGYALGGGLQLALGADVRIAAPDAKLSVREIVMGLVPDMGGTVLMRRLLRDDVLRELMLTGRILTGEEAVELGLVTRVADDPIAKARELAAEIAALSPDAVRAAKRLLNAGASGLTDQEMLEVEADEQADLLRSDNHLEAVSAHFEHRRPIFRD